jgi:hypothetical protein
MTVACDCFLSLRFFMSPNLNLPSSLPMASAVPVTLPRTDSDPIPRGGSAVSYVWADADWLFSCDSSKQSEDSDSAGRKWLTRPATRQPLNPLPPPPSPGPCDAGRLTLLPVLSRSTPNSQAEDLDLWTAHKLHALAEMAVERWVRAQSQKLPEDLSTMRNTMHDCLQATQIVSLLREKIPKYLPPEELKMLCRLPESIVRIRREWSELFAIAWDDPTQATTHHSRKELFIRYSKLCMPANHYDYTSSRGTRAAVYAGLRTGYAGLLKLAGYYDAAAARETALRSLSLDGALPALLDVVYVQVGPAFSRLMETRPVGTRA